MKKKNKKQIEAMERLLVLLKECRKERGKGYRLYFSNLKASSSGMSRTFTIHAITKKGELLNLTYIISQLLGETFTNDGKIRVHGCGMDMLFNTCYEINCTIRRLQGKKYDHGFAYHGMVNTYYNMI